MAIKRDTADALFSTLIRERAEWCCQRCGKFYPVGERGGLHASHVVGRRNRAVRFDPDNAFSLDYACHRYFTENPLAHIEWVKEQLGLERYDALRMRSLLPVKMSPALKAHIIGRLRSALAEMEKLRHYGVTGYLPFNTPYEGEILPIVRRPKKAKKKAGQKKKIPSRPFPKAHRPLRAA
jgi:hypothetical protein